jgi:thiol-disulfide isomerase/thioredoxin
MKHIFFTIIALSLFNCKQPQNQNLEYVISKFNENANKIQNVEYNIHRVDTFPQDGIVWNNKGLAYIERDNNDTIFGLSFYAKRLDINKEYIYKSSIGYEFIEDKKEFKNEKGAVGFLGKPGGQMVSRDIFKLDSIYKNVKLLKGEESYILRYEYEDDTVYDVTQRVKTVYLRKDDFFPSKIFRTSKVLGNRSSTQLYFSDIKINKGNQNKIDQSIEDKINNYTRVNDSLGKQKLLIGKKFPSISLPNLKTNNVINIDSQKPILIDFWETWCGPCIASFPKVEELNKKYSDEILIIGIVSEDKSNALKLIQKKRVAFSNLYGNSALLEEYKVNSFPRYFLIDSDGIVRKEYFGFSNQIEVDIKEMIGTK